MIQHEVDIQTPNGTHSMSADIPGSFKLYILQLTDSVIDMHSTLEKCIRHISSNCGFTVVGWYNRGIIKDQILLAATEVGTISNKFSYSNNNDNKELQVDDEEIFFPSFCTFIPH